MRIWKKLSIDKNIKVSDYKIKPRNQLVKCGTFSLKSLLSLKDFGRHGRVCTLGT